MNEKNKEELRDILNQLSPEKGTVVKSRVKTIMEIVMRTLKDDKKEIQGQISNERIWEKGYTPKEGQEENPHTDNIANLVCAEKVFDILIDTLSEKAMNDFGIDI